MKLIILAAGDAFELDGFNKLLIRHPKYNKSILELYESFFNVDKIQIVVGYRGMEVMNLYPQHDYIYNKKWQTTGSGYSLSLALREEPCYVIASDFLLNLEDITELHGVNDNYVAIKRAESRRLTGLNAQISEGIVKNVYRGKSSNNDPELLGIFKISDPEILRLWKRKCTINPMLYAGEALPFDLFDIPYLDVLDKDISEINTPEDYINFINLHRR